jgi:hypothetical protein
MKKSTIVKIIFLISISIFIYLIIDITKKPETVEEKVEEKKSEDKKEIPESFSRCFYNSKKTDSGLYDKSWLKINISSDELSGEFNNLPISKDTKTGKIESSIDQVIKAKIFNNSREENDLKVWWNSFAEGLSVREELIIRISNGEAYVLFGEMIDRGDGVYVYRNPNNIFAQNKMPTIECDQLDEKITLEKYVIENIMNIVTNNPVLGGKWYVVQVTINPIAHTGIVIYEDGHIRSTGNFVYEYNKINSSINIKNFELEK